MPSMVQLASGLAKGKSLASALCYARHSPRLLLKHPMPLTCQKTNPFFIAFKVRITNKLSRLTKSRSRL